MSDIWKTRYDEMIETCAQTGRERDEARAEVTILINLVADIRAAVGDPTGTLMQDELVERCRHLVITRDEARRDRDEARAEVTDLLFLLDDIRTAVGDQAGTLNGDELAERCRALLKGRKNARRERDEARKIAGDMFVVLDELGCGMKPLPWEDDQ